jgi:hypothetical protein
LVGKVPTDVQTEVTQLEEMEEDKSWMALGSRDKSALMTLPQLLKVIEHNWKESSRPKVEPNPSYRISGCHEYYRGNEEPCNCWTSRR